MKKLGVILSLLFVLTACNSSTSDNFKENETPATNVKENENFVGNKEINVDGAYEKIMKEYTTSEGYRVKEYEDGYTTILSAENKMDIVKEPKIYDFTMLFDYKLEELPGDDGKGFDLRSKDISNINLSKELNYLLMSSFDDHTIWPDSLPKEYDIKIIKEFGMDPGLGIRMLHEKGITGQGVGIAIIDQSLLINHVEYKNQIKLYEEIHHNSDFAGMHGPAVASIAVGKNVGVAPESDLYYIAVGDPRIGKEDSFDRDVYWIAKSIDRIIEINKLLTADNKIRVISISAAIDNPEFKNHKLVEEAIERAENDGIYTISVANTLIGSGRKPLGNPNDLNSYKKGYTWMNIDLGMRKMEEVLVPMDSRYVAGPTGKDKYVFYYSGGISWAVPYTAGLYALCSQVNPNITPNEFNIAIYNTATMVHLDDTKAEYKILNPEGLINTIKK